MKMESTKLSSSSDPTTVNPSKSVNKAEQAEDGRPAIFVDGKLRWITEDGTPGDIVGDGSFYFTQTHDGTFHLFDKGARNERAVEFSKSSSVRFEPFSLYDIRPSH